MNELINSKIICRDLNIKINLFWQKDKNNRFLEVNF